MTLWPHIQTTDDIIKHTKDSWMAPVWKLKVRADSVILKMIKFRYKRKQSETKEPANIAGKTVPINCNNGNTTINNTKVNHQTNFNNCPNDAYRLENESRAVESHGSCVRAVVVRQLISIINWPLNANDWSLCLSLSRNSFPSCKRVQSQLYARNHCVALWPADPFPAADSP